MDLRDYLEQHERELLEKIDFERRQIKLHELKLVPLEGELAEVRRAKAAVGMSNEPLSVFNFPPHPQILTGIPSGGIGSLFGSSAVSGAENVPTGFLGPPSPYANLTMKQLVIKALGEHFHQGATTRQLLDFFRDAWGRNIERTNLSPQISRLYQEGVIGRGDGTKEWYLVPEDRRGKHPYRVIAPVIHRTPTDLGGTLLHNVGDIVWLTPESAEGMRHLQLIGERVPDPDPDED